MEEDIQNYSPTVMFPGTPCSSPDNSSWTEMSYVQLKL